jgi:ABC-type glycerol-3-phosphate transport system substrate-binding protein
MPCSYYFWIMQINVPLLEKYGVPLPEEWTMESVHKVCREFTEKTLNVPDVFAMLGGTREFWKTAMLNEISLAIDYVKNESHIDGIPDSLFEYARNIVEASQAGFFNTSDIPYVFTLYSSRQDLSFNRRNGLRAWLIFEYNDFEYRTFPRAKDGDNGVYYLENAFCINKNGDVKEAWEFIKFALSSEMQNEKFSAISEPVLKSAVEYRFQKVGEHLAEVKRLADEGKDYANAIGETSHTPDEFETAVEYYVSTYRQLLDNVGVPVILDARLSQNILDVIMPETGEEVDIASAKAEVKRIVDVYMQEVGGDIQSGYMVIYIASGIIIVAVAGVILIRTVRRRKSSKKQPAGVGSKD